MGDEIQFIMDIFLHLDKYLGWLIQEFGVLTYFILFLIIFCETGLVITPLLPGDSLLFAAGTFAAIGELQIVQLMLLLIIAAVAGDAVNYWIGAFLGEKLIRYKQGRLIKKEYLNRTRLFFEKHGGKAIILARFIPIVRTFAPFVAGMAKMSRFRFFLFNITGGVIWVSLFTTTGFFFGNIPAVKRNFSWVIFGIIILSLVPLVWKTLKQAFFPKKAHARSRSHEDRVCSHDHPSTS